MQYTPIQSTRTSSKYTNITASGLIATGPGSVQGFVVNSHTSGTLKLTDSLDGTTGTMFNTYTFASGSQSVSLQGANFLTGLYATIGGTADITILFNQ